MAAIKWAPTALGNPLVEARNRLLDKRGKLTNFREALALLQAPASNMDQLSLLASLIRYKAALEETDVRAILWITPELDVGSLPKATRMFPIAIRDEHSASVQRLHDPLLSGMYAWERTRRNRGWLTLSDVMDSVAERTRKNGKKDPSLSIQIFMVLPSTISHKRKELIHWDLYLHGSLAIIHTDEQQANGKPETYYFSHTSLSEPVPVNSLCGSRRSFGKFVDWLQTYEAPPNGGGFIYSGFEHFHKEKEIRLWAAFDPGVSAKVVTATWHLPDLLHHSFIDIIRQAVVHPVDLFLNRTEGVTHNDLDEPQLTAGQNELRQFIGQEEVGWPHGLTDAHTREALKGLCSNVACVRNGEKPVSVLGAFLVLLSAIAHRSGIVPVNVKIEGEPNDFVALLPVQFREAARETLMWLYDLFAALVHDRGGEESQSTIRSIRVRPNQLELKLSIDPLASHSAQKANLAEAVDNYLATRLELHRDLTLWGNSAKAIVEYWLRANLRTDKRDEDGRIFPPSDVFTLDYVDGDLILTLRAPRCVAS